MRDQMGRSVVTNCVKGSGAVGQETSNQEKWNAVTDCAISTANWFTIWLSRSFPGVKTGCAEPRMYVVKASERTSARLLFLVYDYEWLTLPKPLIPTRKWVWPQDTHWIKNAWSLVTHMPPRAFWVAWQLGAMNPTTPAWITHSEFQ